MQLSFKLFLIICFFLPRAPHANNSRRVERVASHQYSDGVIALASMDLAASIYSTVNSTMRRRCCCTRNQQNCTLNQ
jgi:hypothetical protein